MYRSWTKNQGKVRRSLSVQLRFLLFFMLLFLIACSGGIYHTIKPGQTLYRISRTYGVSESALARANRIVDPSRVRVGTRLYVPGADRVLSVPVITPRPAKKTAVVTRTPVKKTVVVRKSTPKKKTVIKKTTAPQPRTVQSTEIKKLHWPLRGKILRSFSTKAKAGSGKGIEIAARSGSPVAAAEAGKVIYSGDGVNGYGHLIILQHENDMFTVYGFNQRNYARQGDFVSRGEKIALSGVPPAGGAARLHFEVRKGKQAVNPILYLP